MFVTKDVEEAIFLSDRVFVMTARPGKTKAEIDITLPRPRSYELKSSEAFLNLLFIANLPKSSATPIAFRTSPIISGVKG